MDNLKEKNSIIIPAGRKPWAHELRVANILAMAGHRVEFLPESNNKTADILLDGVAYEIKSPKSANFNSMEHNIKKALTQSSNIVFDSSRIKGSRDENICRFLINQIRIRKQIKSMILVTKHGEIIDIMSRV